MEKKIINLTQEVNVVSQVKVATAIVAAIKVNNETGNLDCARNCLASAMEANSKAYGEPYYGSISYSWVKSGLHFTTKHLDYYVKVEKTPEETTLILVKNTYKYD